MIFRRPSVRYGDSGPAQSPYDRAGAVWDARIGSARQQAFHWRLVALGGLAVIAAQAGGMIWLASRDTVTPWVVEVDRLGRVQASGPARADWRPSDPQIGWRLGEWVRQVRSLPNDPVVMRENWLQAYTLVTTRGAQALNLYARQADPFSKVGQTQVSIAIDSVVRASADSFRVSWTERRFANGDLEEERAWVAIVRVVEQPSKDAEALKRNPMGVYVDAFDWTPEGRS
ncbi:conjugal transfer protein TrbF [Caulobacter segnis]|uniref:conjugal transfer protein TrbF n=1 Tax=Caulobacter segnis TaxID=88688 RepID=UPI00241056C2|nr:conjugal transfer protein TrbF [Caulobacter segnis]MDG2522891.1 conjugal transfer protein TrbF [Caulobacter segnis]